MDDLLKVSSTRWVSGQTEHITPTIKSKSPLIQESEPEVPLDSWDVILKALQSKPSFKTLQACLRWLQFPPAGLSIKVPGPQATRLLSVLVNETIPNFWRLLNGESKTDYAKERKSLVRLLTSIAGVGALCARLRISLDAGKQEKDIKPKIPKERIKDDVRDVLEVLHFTLRGSGTFQKLWQDIEGGVVKPIQRHLLAKELVSLLTSGKVLSLAAEALSFCDFNRGEEAEFNWLGEGKIYASWLGENIRTFLKELKEADTDTWKIGASLLVKGISLGHDHIVEASLSGMLNGDRNGMRIALSLFTSFSAFEKTKVLSIILRLMSKRLMSTSDSNQERLIRGMAYALEQLAQNDTILQNYLVDWLTSGVSGVAGAELGVRRAVLTVIFSAKSSMDSDSVMDGRKTGSNHGEQVLKQLLDQFGDKLFIQHAPVLNQEVCTQDLLIAVGWMLKINRHSIQELSKSSPYLNAVSNRLAATSDRARFLGLVFGMAVSERVDTPAKKLDFGVEGVDSDEGKWYRNLVHVEDAVGSMDDLVPAKSKATLKPIQKPSKKPEQNKKAPSSSKIVGITEITDESDNNTDSSDDNLPIYAKPDSDQEDEEEDPTLIQRNKPVAPVYIRDLITGLRDSENYDRHKLSISTAASLIRRKSKFGSEVTEHIEQLASQITGLQDQYDLDKFQEMRIQAMVALVVAQPVKMGQWFSSMLFSGDYSMSQRASMLTALTMAARELAGYREEDAELTGAYVANEQLFPSKKLPDKYDRAYRIDAAPVNALSQQLERTMIKPMAAEAADKLTGPNVLKTRTFSSRMEVEKKRKRPITNELAKIVADGFFYPLAGRWRTSLQVYGPNSVFQTPFLQAHFLKTIALILSASGANTLSLPAMTVEFWALLLSVRTAALAAKPVLEALLFAFLTVLDINGNDQRRIAEDHSRELLETRAWVQQVLENLGSGSQEDDKIRVLAAGVLVRTQEVVDQYQRLMLGELVDYM